MRKNGSRRRLGILLERDDARFARLGGVLDDLLDCTRRVQGFFEQDRLEGAESRHEVFRRVADHDCAEGSAEDDDGGRHLSDVLELAAFHQQPGQNRADPHQESPEGRQVRLAAASASLCFSHMSYADKPRLPGNSSTAGSVSCCEKAKIRRR